MKISVEKTPNDVYLLRDESGAVVPAQGLEQALTLMAQIMTTTHPLFGGRKAKGIVVLYDESAGNAFTGVNTQAGLPPAAQQALPSAKPSA